MKSRPRKTWNSEFARVDLYRRNPFRITGLSAADDRRAVRQRQDHIAAVLEAGKAVPVWFEDPPFSPAPPLTADEVHTAFEQLADPARRIAHEVLWMWGEKALGCGCPAQVHNEHDRAVVAHEMALELERSGKATGPLISRMLDAVWSEAAEGWARSLGRPELREHIDHRARELNVPGWDAVRLDALLAELPRALVEPLVELAAASDDPERLVGLAHRWHVGEHVLDELVTGAAQQLLGRLNTSLRRMMFAADATELYAQLEQFMRELRRHEALKAGSAEVLLLRNQAAYRLTDGAAAQLSAGETSREETENWFELARRLAGDHETSLRLAKDQRAVLTDIRRRSSLPSRLRRRLHRAAGEKS